MVLTRANSQPQLVQKREFLTESDWHLGQVVVSATVPDCGWGFFKNIRIIKGTTTNRCTVGMPKTKEAPPQSQGFLPLALADRAVQMDTSVKAAISKIISILTTLHLQSH